MSGTSPGPYTYLGIPPTPTEYDTQFYVGPLGDLIPLPGVESGVDTPLAVFGGMHTSLTGAFTRDVFGYKRSWTWTYPLLTDRQARHIEAIQRNLVPGPLYLIDPRRPNRLPEQIASGGSLLRSPQGFIPSNTTTALWRRLSHAPAEPRTLPTRHVLRGCLEWQLLAAGNAGLELAGHGTDGRHNIPVRGGELLLLSFWATGPTGSTAGATITVYDDRARVLSTQTAPQAELAPAEWRRVQQGIACPSDAAYLRVTPTCGSATPVGSLFLTALSVQPYHPAYVPGLIQHCDDPDLDDWPLGGGAPQVVPVSGSTGYVRAGLQSSALTLVER